VKATGRILTVAVALAAHACSPKVKQGYFATDKAAAIKALGVFHQRWNAKDFEAVYQDASEAFRAQPKGQAIAAMKAKREVWGKVVESTEVASSCAPNEVSLLLAVKFENDEGGEVIDWHVPEEEARLAGFQIVTGPIAAPADANNCKSTPPK
jgi:hypothetical protein